MADAKKKGLNTNANSYTIIYAAVLVIVVAFLLAFISRSLKSTQDANVALDKKKQVLAALNIRDLDNEQSDAKYKEVVKADIITDAEGNVTDEGSEGAEGAGFTLTSSDYKAGRLALYVCEVDGETKYVIPVYGMGLWGAIWGYIAVNDDFNTVYGAYFNHDSETAGLGAEIKDSRAWQDRFKGKTIYIVDEDGELGDVALAVKKKVENAESEVDAVTGATLTCDGVTLMLADGMAKYKPLAERIREK